MNNDKLTMANDFLKIVFSLAICSSAKFSDTYILLIFFQDEEESIEPVPIVPSYTLPSARELTACKYVPRFNVRSKQPSNVYADLPPMKPTFKQGASAPKKRK